MILEMLVYSDEGFIKLLPAVPEDLNKGSVEGVWLYTFAKIEKMEWDMEQGTASVELSSVTDQQVEISFPTGYRKVCMDGEEFLGKGNGFMLDLRKDKVVKLDFYF